MGIFESCSKQIMPQVFHTTTTCYSDICDEIQHSFIMLTQVFKVLKLTSWSSPLYPLSLCFYWWLYSLLFLFSLLFWICPRVWWELRSRIMSLFFSFWFALCRYDVPCFCIILPPVPRSLLFPLQPRTVG